MIDFESKNLHVSLCSAENILVFLSGGRVNVIVGQSAEIKLGQAINYIESGKAELRPLVTEASASAISAADFADQAQNVLNEMNNALSDYTKISDSIFYEEI